MTKDTEATNDDLATERPVVVPSNVCEGLEVVRRSGRTNMFDRPMVISIADEYGFPETAAWVRKNRTEYSKGMFRGFEGR